MEQLRQEVERLYDRYSHQFFICALAVTGSRESAEDAVQDAFCRTLRVNPNVENLRAYLFSSVRNAAVDLVRKKKRHDAWSVQALFKNTDAVADEDERQHGLKKIAHGLTRLGADEREVIMQHLIAGLKHREIAVLMDRPLGTVTAWYHRGLKKLKDYVGAQDE